jgi:type II secretion system protein G
MRTFGSAIDNFKMDCGRYPTNIEGLEALVTAPPALKGRWKGPYLEAPRIPLDPWGHAYGYERILHKGSDSFALSCGGGEATPRQRALEPLRLTREELQR